MRVYVERRVVEIAFFSLRLSLLFFLFLLSF